MSDDLFCSGGGNEPMRRLVFRFTDVVGSECANVFMSRLENKINDKKAFFFYI